MPRKSKFELLTAQAQRLFALRLYFALHIIAFIVALVLTRGRLARSGIIFIIWIVALLIHAVYFALVENREATLRQTYQNMNESESSDKLKHDELDDDQNYYTIGADGELIRMDETQDRQEHH